MISIRQIPPLAPGEVARKKIKFTLGGLAPNLTPDPHVPRNLSRVFWDAHDAEKISEIALMVAEKIESEKKIWHPLAAKPEAFEVT